MRKVLTRLLMSERISIAFIYAPFFQVHFCVRVGVWVCICCHTGRNWHFNNQKVNVMLIWISIILLILKFISSEKKNGRNTETNATMEAYNVHFVMQWMLCWIYFWKRLSKVIYLSLSGTFSLNLWYADIFSTNGH